MDFSALDLNDDKTCFRLGFLQRCLEEKLSAEQLEERIKTAAWPAWLAALGSGLYAAARGGAKMVGNAGKLYGVTSAALPFAGGLIGGGALGHYAANAVNPPEPDIEAERLKELADMYKIQAARMKARRAIKYRPTANR